MFSFNVKKMVFFVLFLVSIKSFASPVITSPANGSTFSGATVTFTWDHQGTSVDLQDIKVGSSVNANDIYDTGLLDGTANNSVTVNNLPTDGRTIYVRYSYSNSTGWHQVFYTYTAAFNGTSGTPIITSPANGSTFSGSTVTFTWDHQGTPVDLQDIKVGSSENANDIYDTGLLNGSANNSVTVNNLPTDGRTIYVRYSYSNSTGWHQVFYTYTADSNGTSGTPVITSPATGSTLSGSTATFTWDHQGTPVDLQDVKVGSSENANDIYDTGLLNGTANNSITVNNLPTDGRTIYVRYSYSNSTGWHQVFYTYTASNSLSNYPSYFPTPVDYSNWSKANAQTMTAPPFLGSVIDPDTNRSIWRLGGLPSEMNSVLAHPEGQNSILRQHAQHFYSRTEPVNANETYVLGARRKATVALWKLADKNLVAWLPIELPESNYQQYQILWDKNQNDVFWYTSGNKLYKATINFNSYDVDTELWDSDSFQNYDFITFGPGEGDFSDDGKKIVIAGQMHGSNNITIISYMIDNKMGVASKVVQDMNWAGVDPTGQYVVFDDIATNGRKSTFVLPFNLSGTPRILYNHLKHCDFVVDKSGESWIVYSQWQGVLATKLSSSFFKRVWPTKVDAGDPTNLITFEKGEIPNLSIRETMSGHVSRVADIPGVVLISRDIDGGLYFVDIDNPGKTFYVGNTRHGKYPYPELFTSEPTEAEKQAWGVDEHGTVTDYYREPRGSASPSGKYIFFTSDYHEHNTGYSTIPEPPFKAFLNMISLDE